MAREYMLILGENIDRRTALNLLRSSPFFHIPATRFQEGEIWLTVSPRTDFAEVRLFPEPNGFFLEITSLPTELSDALNVWIAQMRSLGSCSIIDNDSDEVVDVFR
jgi:hypothetical protein